jgi:hypothetical protein
MREYISREAAINKMRTARGWYTGKDEDHAVQVLQSLPAADVAPIVRTGKDRLTKLGVNGIYGLVKVKDNEQEVDSPHKNTLAAILECFQRLAEYENAEYGTLMQEADHA